MLHDVTNVLFINIVVIFTSSIVVNLNTLNNNQKFLIRFQNKILVDDYQT